MKTINSWAFILGLILWGNNQVNTKIENETEPLKKDVASKDKREITVLIRRVLNWSKPESKLTPPVVEDKKGKFFTGINLAEHRRNLQQLKEINLFDAEFVSNYNQLILTLDKKLRKGSYGPWLVGDTPSFNFTRDVNPWCSCQDVPYDKPNPYDFVEVEIVSLNGNQGEFNWKWGGLGPKYDPQHGYDPGWKKFRYRFRVVKKNNQWKIAYLEGFDFEKGVSK